MPAGDDPIRPLQAAIDAIAITIAAVSIGMALVLGWDRPALTLARLAAPFVLLVAVALAGNRLARHHGSSPVVRAFRAGYPLVLLPVLYMGAVRIAELDPLRYHDALLARSDAFLFAPWTGGGPVWPLGGPVEEAANLLYVSYYLAIPLAFMVMARRGGIEGATRFALALIAAFAICSTVWIVFPSGGLHPTGAPHSEPWGPFTMIAHGIYAVQPHFAAAFPSGHVADAAVIAVVLRSVGVRRTVWLWVLGMYGATIIGQYHYAVDGLAGLAVGVAAARFALTTRGLSGSELHEHRGQGGRRRLPIPRRLLGHRV